MTRKNPNVNYGERSQRRVEKLKRVLAARQFDLTVVAENIYDPHNLSAMLRSCDAVGVYRVYLVYDGSQPFPKISDKSSASAKKWIETTKYSSIEECYAELRRKGMKIYATSLSKEAVSLYELDLTEPVALVFGNEHNGITEKAAELADGNFLIPQKGMTQSLNVSVACAVSLYEAFRQRSLAGKYESSQIGEDEFERLLEEWKKK